MLVCILGNFVCFNCHKVKLCARQASFLYQTPVHVNGLLYTLFALWCDYTQTFFHITVKIILFITHKQCQVASIEHTKVYWGSLEEDLH